MSLLPKGWVEVEIGALCELVNGKAFKPSDWGQVGLPIVRIQNLNNPRAGFNYYNGKVEEKFLIENGQLLFAWSGTPGTSFGAHVWEGAQAVLNQHIFKIEFDEHKVYRSFFRLGINHKLEDLINKAHGGVGLRHVTKGKFEQTKISLPPLAEQKRIVAKVESLTAKSARARAEIDRIGPLVRSYKASLLSAAFIGALTQDWRELRGCTGEQKTVPIKEIAAVVTGFTPPTKERERYFGGAIPFFKPTDLDAGYFVQTPRETLTEDGAARGRKIPRGAILVTCIGATIGKTGFARVDCCTNQQINSLIPDGKLVQPEWLYWMIASPEFQQSILDNSSATTLPIINKGRFERLIVPSISLQEQHEIVRRIETAFAKIDRLAAEAKRALELTDRLDEKILAKAFRGELVPQDPNDEPASVLLERIRAERAGAPKAKRGRGGRSRGHG